MKQILEGLSYLHQNWIMHRDLKTANLIVDKDGIVKIIDFNSAKIFGSPNAVHSKNTTTMCYQSPEQLFSNRVFSNLTLLNLLFWSLKNSHFRLFQSEATNRGWNYN